MTSIPTFKFSPPFCLNADCNDESLKLDSESQSEFTFRPPLIAVEMDCKLPSDEKRTSKSTEFVTYSVKDPPLRLEQFDASQPMKSIFGNQQPKNCSSGDSAPTPNRASRMIEELLLTKFPFVKHPPENCLNTTRSLPSSKTTTEEKIQKTFWTCPTCYLNNYDNAVKCVICENLKSDEKPAIKSLLQCDFGESWQRSEDKASPSTLTLEKKRTSSTRLAKQAASIKTSSTSWVCKSCSAYNRVNADRCAACTSIRSGLKIGRRDVGEDSRPGYKYYNQLLSPTKDGCSVGEKLQDVTPKKVPLGLRSPTLSYLRDCGIDMEMESECDLKDSQDLSFVSKQNEEELRAKFEDFWESGQLPTKNGPVKRKSSTLLDEPAIKIANIEDPKQDCVKPSSSESFTSLNEHGFTFSTLLDSPRWKNLFEEERLGSFLPKEKRLTVAEKFSNYWGKKKKIPKNAWECPKCSLNNSNDSSKCACCSTLQPGVSATTTCSTSPIFFDDNDDNSSKEVACQTLETESLSASTQSQTVLNSNNTPKEIGGQSTIDHQEQFHFSDEGKNQNLPGVMATFMQNICRQMSSSENDCSKKISSEFSKNLPTTPTPQSTPMFNFGANTPSSQQNAPTFTFGTNAAPTPQAPVINFGANTPSSQQNAPTVTFETNTSPTPQSAPVSNFGAITPSSQQNAPMFTFGTSTATCQQPVLKSSSPPLVTQVQQNSRAFAPDDNQLSQQVTQNGSSATLPTCCSQSANPFNQTLPKFDFGISATSQQNQNVTSTQITTVPQNTHDVKESPFTFPLPPQNQNITSNDSAVVSQNTHEVKETLPSFSFLPTQQNQNFTSYDSAIVPQNSHEVTETLPLFSFPLPQQNQNITPNDSAVVSQNSHEGTETLPPFTFPLLQQTQNITSNDSAVVPQNSHEVKETLPLFSFLPTQQNQNFTSYDSAVVPQNSRGAKKTLPLFSFLPTQQNQYFTSYDSAIVTQNSRGVKETLRSSSFPTIQQVQTAMSTHLAVFIQNSRGVKETLPSSSFPTTQQTQNALSTQLAVFPQNTHEVKESPPSFSFLPTQQNQNFKSNDFGIFPQNSLEVKETLPSSSFPTTQQTQNAMSTQLAVFPLNTPEVRETSPSSSFPTTQQNQLALINQSQKPANPFNPENFDNTPSQFFCTTTHGSQFPQIPKFSSTIGKSTSSNSFNAATRQIHFAESSKATSTFAVQTQSSTKSCTAIVGGNGNNTWNYSTGSTFSSQRATFDTDFSDSKFQLRRSTSSISMNSVPSDMSVESNKSPREVGMEVDIPNSPLRSPCLKGKRTYATAMEVSKTTSTSVGSVFPTSTNSTKELKTSDFLNMGDTSAATFTKQSFSVKKAFISQSLSNIKSPLKSPSFTDGPPVFGSINTAVKSSVTSSSSTYCYPVTQVSPFTTSSTTLYAKSTISVSTSIKQSTVLATTNNPSSSALNSNEDNFQNQSNGGIFNGQTSMSLLPNAPFSENPVTNSFAPFGGTAVNTTLATPQFNSLNSAFGSPGSGLGTLETFFPGVDAPTSFNGGFSFNNQQGVNTQFNASNPAAFQFNPEFNPNFVFGNGNASATNAHFVFGAGNPTATNPNFNPQNPASTNNEAHNPFVPKSRSPRPILRAVRRVRKH